LKWYQEALDFNIQAGDEQKQSATLHQMAGVLKTRGDLVGAMTLYEQSLDLKERVGDLKGKSATLHEMAGVLKTRGNLVGAMTLYEQSLDLKERVGDLKGKSATLHQMAGVLETRGDLAGAMSLYEQSLDLKERVGDLQGKASTIFNIATVQYRQGQRDLAFANARESLRLFEHLGATREIAQVREILQQMEAGGGGQVTIPDAVAAWVAGGRDEQQLGNLINAICNLYVGTMREGNSEQREALAHDLAHLRAAGPLPIAGAGDFLNLLQHLLRGEDSGSGEAGRLRAMLPDPFPGALQTMEQAIRGEQGEPAPAAPAQQEATMPAEVEAMLSHLTPEQRAELEIVAQIAPLLQQGIATLLNEQAGTTDRARVAEQLEQIAEQAAAGEEEGSPWLEGATALRAVAGWLRGAAPAAEDLPPTYRAVVGGMN